MYNRYKFYRFLKTTCNRKNIIDLKKWFIIGKYVIDFQKMFIIEINDIDLKKGYNINKFKKGCVDALCRGREQ